jgi:hypothetical protein
MKDLLDKLSSYNLFNYLLPGILFAVLSKRFTHFSVIQDSLVLGVFIYYFIGLVISRVGSLVIEPVLKKISFLKFAEYGDFVAASKSDAKIELLSETNNMYRTLLSMLVSLLLLKGYEVMAMKYQIPDEVGGGTLTLLLLIMFLFSYRKQTDYVRKRVGAAKE